MSDTRRSDPFYWDVRDYSEAARAYMGITAMNADPQFDQESFAFGDPGTESGHAIDAQNTDRTVEEGGNGNYQFFLRWLIVQTLANADQNLTTTFKLQYQKNGGGYVDVTAASSNVRVVDDPNITDGASTTSRLTAGTGVPIAGSYDEGDGTWDAITWDPATNNREEANFLSSLEVVDADMADGDVLDFRVVESNDTLLDAYTVANATLTWQAAPGGTPVNGAITAGTVSVVAGLLTAALGALAGSLTAATVDVQAGVLAGAQAPLSAPMVAGTVDARAGVLAASLGAQAGAITAGTVDTQAGILTGSAGGLDPVSGAITAGTVDASGGVLAGSQTALGSVLTTGTVEVRGGVLTATEGALDQALTPGTVEVQAGVLAGEAGGVAGAVTTGTVEAKAGVLVGLASVGADLTAGTTEVRGGVLSGGSAPTSGAITAGTVEVRAGVLSATPAATSAALTAGTVEARGHALGGTLAAKAGVLTAGTAQVQAGVLGGVSGQQPISAALVAGTVEVAASPFLFPLKPTQILGAAAPIRILGARARPRIITAKTTQNGQ